MGKVTRNASYDLLVKLGSDKMILQLSNESGKVMARFQFQKSNLVEDGRNIGFSHLPERDETVRAGTITSVELGDDMGNVLIQGIPFAADNSADFRFRHDGAAPDSLTFTDGEVIRWTKGTILCHLYRVVYRKGVTWTREA